jgi:hypothetical protein
MKIDATTCYKGIFPISQQIVGGKHLWKLISDIANGILGNKVEDSHKLRDFTYGVITFLPVVGTIFNLFLYIIVFREYQDEKTGVIEKKDSEEITTPKTEEIEYSDSNDLTHEKSQEDSLSENFKETETVHTPHPSLEENSEENVIKTSEESIPEDTKDGFKTIKKKKKYKRVMSLKDIFHFKTKHDAKPKARLSSSEVHHSESEN